MKVLMVKIWNKITKSDKNNNTYSDYNRDKFGNTNRIPDLFENGHHNLKKYELISKENLNNSNE